MHREYPWKFVSSYRAGRFLVAVSGVTGTGFRYSNERGRRELHDRGRMIEVIMKGVGRWTLLIALYALSDLGSHEGVWPMLMHFRHTDWQVPDWIDGVVNWIAIPFGVAFLLTVSVSNELKKSLPWPLLLAPFVLMTLSKYVRDAFYPPYARYKN